MGDLREEEVVKDMTPKLIGEIYLRKASEGSKKKRRYGLYECPYCGKHWEATTYSIKNKCTKSCGCLRGDAHGLTSHKFYNTWKYMVGRCTNPKIKAYKDYGGRGITVCDEWLDIRNFVDWAEETYPNIEGLSLDRIDNNKGYSPENCRWADRAIQGINQRMQKNNTSGYTGVTWHKNVKRWCSTLKSQGVLINVGTFKDKIEAVLARDNYIIENNLPHKLSTDYMKEGKINE